MTIAPPHRVAYVQPAVTLRAPGLQNHLVELAVLLDEGDVALQALLVGDEDVGCLAQRVLTARHAAYGEIELRTTVAARDGDDAAVLAKRLQHHLAEHHQSDDDHRLLRRVVDAILDGGARTKKLAKGEMGGEEHPLHPLLFQLCVFHKH